MPAILIADSLSEEGRQTFEQAEGFTVDYKPDIELADLKNVIGNYEGLVVRSRAQVPAEALEYPGSLRVIGRAGVGVDNIDVQAATEKGIIVMNTPGGNTISTAENAMSLMLALARNIPKADASMKAGRWDKKNLAGVELCGKVLGIVGLGRIGQEVARRAEAFGMRAIGYDPFIAKDVALRAGVELVSLEEIWPQADFITVHTPLNDDTRGLVGKETIGKMKPSARIVNCARGGIVDEAALIEALEEGRVAGAALDVYETEPLPEDHPLRKLDNVVLTPHLSASTSEAQEKVAVEIAQQIVDFLSGRAPRNAVNAPSVDAEALESMRPYLDLAERLGRFLGQYVEGPVHKFSVKCSGAVLDHPSEPITTAAAVGFLSCRVERGEINYVNAGFLMKKRGVEIIESRSSELFQYANLITLEGHLPDGGKVIVSGSMRDPRTPRIVMLNGKNFDAEPSGDILVVENRDVPGIIGAIGTLLGDHQVNIAQMTWGRSRVGGDAITLVNTDQPVTGKVIEDIRALPNIVAARLIHM